MTLSVRAYALEQQARAAAAALHSAGFNDSSVTVLAPNPGEESRTTEDAVYQGRLDEGESRLWAHQLRQGHWVVSVKAMLGRGQLAEDILGAHEPLAVGADAQAPSGAAPFSDWLGIPTLRHKPSNAYLITSLHTQSFGFRMLSSNPAPLSSLFGLKLLTAGKSTTKLSDKAAPLSSMVGLPLLKKKKR